jgi:hypothetical protein
MALARVVASLARPQPFGREFIMKFGGSRPDRPLAHCAFGRQCCVLPLWPPRWRVLPAEGGRLLWLSVPESSRQIGHIAHFVGDPARRLWLGALLKVDSLLPRAHALPEMEMPRNMRRGLCFEVPVAGARPSVIETGAAGPMQRASAIFTTVEGEAVAYAKVARVPSADEVIRAEAAWLRRLTGVADLSGRVPQLLDEGTTLNGRCYFVTRIAPTTRSSLKFSAAHIGFLAALGRTHVESRKFSASPVLQRLEGMLARLDLCVDRAAVFVLKDALRDCARGLAGVEVPAVVAHGDFTPSNMRRDRGSLFVFDWEQAHAGANPLSDLLHFLLAPLAAMRHDLLPRALWARVRSARARALLLYPEWHWTDSAVASLALAYLIESVARRVLAHRCLDMSDPLARNYWRLLETRAGWLPFRPGALRCTVA